MLGACFFVGYSLENITSYHFRFSGIIITVSTISSSVISCSISTYIRFFKSILLPYFLNWLITSCSIVFRLASHVRILIWTRYLILLIVSRLYCTRLHQRFQHIDTLNVKRCFFMALLTDNSLSIYYIIRSYFYFSSSRKLAYQKHN